jgi:hypothetical protein
LYRDSAQGEAKIVFGRDPERSGLLAVSTGSMDKRDLQVAMG